MSRYPNPLGCSSISVSASAGLDILREQQNGEIRLLGAQLDRGARALVGLRRRHAHVDDRELGPELAHGRPQRLGVAHLRDDVVALAGQQAAQTLAHEHPVLGDHDSQGSSPLTLVPRPGSLTTRIEPPSAAKRSARPARPEPRLASAPPIPSSTTLTRRRAPSCSARDRQLARGGVAHGVRDCLGGEEVGRSLDAAREARHLGVDGDRQRRSPRQRAQRLGQAVLAQHGRIDAAGELAEILDGGAELGRGLFEQRADVDALTGLVPAPRDLQRQRERDEALLRAVVDVALDAPPLGVLRGDDARAGGAHVLQLAAHLDAQPRDLEREPGRRA